MSGKLNNLAIFAIDAGGVAGNSASKNTIKVVKQLNLPGYSFRIIEEDGFRKIFDPVRKKFVRLTPEEWVRQNFITYLVRVLGYPVGLISVERKHRWNRLSRRTDILVHNRKGVPVMVVECKAPNVRIDSSVFDQVFSYNLKLNVSMLIVTNGVMHFACRITDSGASKFTFLENLPAYCDLGSFLQQ